MQMGAGEIGTARRNGIDLHNEEALKESVGTDRMPSTGATRDRARHETEGSCTIPSNKSRDLSMMATSFYRCPIPTLFP